MFTHHFGSRCAAVDYLAAVGGQSGGDGNQSNLNDQTLRINVGHGGLNKKRDNKGAICKILNTLTDILRQTVLILTNGKLVNRLTLNYAWLVGCGSFVWCFMLLAAGVIC